MFDLLELLNLQHLIMFSDILDSASVVEDSFEYLDAPIERIAGADVPMPYAPNLEKLSLPQVDFILYHGLVNYILFSQFWGHYFGCMGYMYLRVVIKF